LFFSEAEDMAEAIEVMAKSFAGTAQTDPEGGFDWAMGPKLRTQWENEARLDFVRSNSR